MNEVSARLELRGLTKAYGRTVALAGVDLSVRAGEIHALLGENGAGKSTLLKIVAGTLAPDAGSMELDGAVYRPTTPQDAIDAGVAMVHQELSLCPHLSIAENILLGAMPARFGFVQRAVLDARARAAIERVLGRDAHAALDPHRRVGDLPLFAQQLVEIARAIAHPACRVLLLDEPTSRLARAEVDGLFRLLRALRDERLAIVYIAHDLEEVRAIADRYSVLRDGSSVGAGRLDEISNDALVAMMAGRRVEQRFPRSDRAPGEVVLELRELAGERLPVDATLELRRGEVVGIAGLVGSGRTELLRAIFGLDAVRRGVVRVGAYSGPANPKERLAQGVGMLSEDRKNEGLALALSIAENITLSNLAPCERSGFLVPSLQERAARGWIERLGIRATGASQRVSDLSGGNQQKVALARLLHCDVDVLLLDEPTCGIDVASKADVYRLIDELASAGRAILLVSSYLPELLGVCDRIAVMRRGRLGGARPAAGLTEHALIAEATGA